MDSDRYEPPLLSSRSCFLLGCSAFFPLVTLVSSSSSLHISLFASFTLFSLSFRLPIFIYLSSSYSSLKSSHTILCQLSLYNCFSFSSSIPSEVLPSLIIFLSVISSYPLIFIFSLQLCLNILTFFTVQIHVIFSIYLSIPHTSPPPSPRLSPTSFKMKRNFNFSSRKLSRRNLSSETHALHF
jgi:hypothetical protein